jgi:hypothetical protein
MALRIVNIDLPFTVMSMEADTDYLLARMISFLGAKFHNRAGFSAQQACEKYMKAVSIQQNKKYPETHNLKQLASYCEPCDPFFGEAGTKRIVEQFDLFDQVGRYGGTAKFDPLSRGQTVGGGTLRAAPGVLVAGASIWTSSHLHDLDAFVFKTRSLLNYASINWDDGLKSILAGNERSAFVGTWRGPVPLRDVLTRDNRYFTP